MNKFFEIGSLVYHKSKYELEDSYNYGIIVDSWLNQKKFEGVPEHDKDQVVVSFNSGLRIININDVKVF